MSQQINLKATYKIIFNNNTVKTLKLNNNTIWIAPTLNQLSIRFDQHVKGYVSITRGVISKAYGLSNITNFLVNKNSSKTWSVYEKDYVVIRPTYDLGYEHNSGALNFYTTSSSQSVVITSKVRPISGPTYWREASDDGYYINSVIHLTNPNAYSMRITSNAFYYESSQGGQTMDYQGDPMMYPGKSFTLAPGETRDLNATSEDTTYYILNYNLTWSCNGHTGKKYITVEP